MPTFRRKPILPRSLATPINGGIPSNTTVEMVLMSTPAPVPTMKGQAREHITRSQLAKKRLVAKVRIPSCFNMLFFVRPLVRNVAITSSTATLLVTELKGIKRRTAKPTSSMTCETPIRTVGIPFTKTRLGWP